MRKPMKLQIIQIVAALIAAATAVAGQTLKQVAALESAWAGRKAV
jgi:hypothetical protein